MAKQKCGSCRFYQEADLAGSGWCHHPQRKVSKDVMLLVRRNELACRDDWARSLWSPRDGEAEEPAFQRPAVLGPVAPASADSLRSLLDDDATREAPGVSGEDVLLSEARIVSDVHLARESARAPTPTVALDSRSAVFRARETFRERARARAAVARQLGAPEAAPMHNESSPEVVAPRSLEQREATPPSTRRPDLEPGISDHFDGRAAVAVAALPPADAQPEAAEWAHEPTTDRQFSGQHEHLAEREMSPSAVVAGAPICPPEATSHQSVSTAQVGEPKLPTERLLPSWFRTDLPRVCRACRDFRPAADGQRGWCGNAWAFTHRRLVDQDDIAPCASSLGDWWAPVDEVWLVAADVSAHGRATPLLDRLIARESVERRRS